MDQGVGREVERLMKERGWSRTKLAAEADMSASGVSMILNGQRNLTTTTLAKLATALGVEVRDLFPLDQATLPLEDIERAVQRGMEDATKSLAEVKPPYSVSDAQRRSRRLKRVGREALALATALEARLETLPPLRGPSLSDEARRHILTELTALVELATELAVDVLEAQEDAPEDRLEVERTEDAYERLGRASAAIMQEISEEHERREHVQEGALEIQEHVRATQRERTDA
jgi:transcriptional regulator with XRE-family HTH domain